MRKQLEERALGHVVPEVGRLVIEELVERLLSVAECAFDVGVVRTPHDVSIAYVGHREHGGGIVLERGETCFRKMSDG